MQREGFIMSDTDILLDNIEMPRMDNIDLPELTFDLEDFSAESLFKAIGIEPDAPPKPMEIRIQGKRIWWKPWRRRPDKVYHFPNVTFRFIDDDIMEAIAQ